MIPKLPIDCINNILEYLEDKVSLHSCLLVNRLWCRISVVILWRNIWDFKQFGSTQIIRTLITCLPNKSKETLFKNKVTSIPTSRTPLFNYASFLEVVSIPRLLYVNRLYNNIYNETNLTTFLITKEILKMFMKQIPSLKRLDFCLIDDDDILDSQSYYIKVISISSKFIDFPGAKEFVNFPGAKDCLRNLLELKCSSEIDSNFFYQLSKICHNIQSLKVILFDQISIELENLILSQKKLKSLSIKKCNYDDNNIKKDAKMCNRRGNVNMLIKFLENNGKNLKEFYVNECNNSLNSTIADNCLNLKSLYTLIPVDGIEILKMNFNNCQQLEFFITLCEDSYLEGNQLLEIVVNHSPKSFHKLVLHSYLDVKLDSKVLESFFIGWKDRISYKSFSFIISEIIFMNNNKNRKLIRKYKNLGVIKEFEIITYSGDAVNFSDLSLLRLFKI
ncbi:hypothetical protein GLOIN_2v1784405 [Rhizophagus clarus]|uniref:F-box domain-containing protein n=1 Tax=Rhizophagus clarus TaxID=94130 RepID=A0A8H3QCD4_9GLOM|nr:hypothetical protein GLOIN_2v1784405 [Rhizophagus clarus]